MDVWPVAHSEKEHSRLVAAGRRTGTGERCSLVLVHEVGGTRAVYPHDAEQTGARLPYAEAVRTARRILGLDFEDV